jgi:hypothetical protein
MRRIVPLVAFTGLLGIVISADAQQQPPIPQPRLSNLMPSGAKAGTTVEVTFAGVDAEEPEALIFSHPGIKAEAIIPPEPKQPPVDPKKPAPKMPTPAKQAIAKFKVTVAPDVPIGYHDVRLVNRLGVSNPRPFVVGDRPEIDEKEPNNDVPNAQRIEQNVTINGVVSSATDVDYYVFAGKKGQRVLFSLVASSIDSRLHGAIEVYDSTGRRIAFNRNYDGSDALADVTIPADGDYLVRIFEFTYTAGSADYFYRLTIGTIPWIDAVFPPMIEPGKTATLTLYGRNLPGGQLDSSMRLDGRPLEKATVSVTAPAEPTMLRFSGQIIPMSSGLDGFEYRLRGPNGASNPVLLTYSKAPVTIENDANDTPATAQSIQVPCEVAGRLDKRDDRDFYAFTAKKGDVFMIELFGDRIGTPADFYFVVRPATEKAGPINESDDGIEILHPQQFFTRSTDPVPFRFAVNEDGKYLVMVAARDGGTEFGPRHRYRLRVSPEHPDFRIVLMSKCDNLPDATVVRADGQQNLDVFVWRQDGFKGNVELSVSGLPAGVTCPPQRVGPNQKHAALVLSAAADAKPFTGVITVKGTAVIDGKPVTHEARSATISWQVPPQQNIPTISRLDRQLILAVRDKAPFRLIPATDKLTIKQGDKATLDLKLTRAWADLKAPIQVQAMPSIQNQPMIAGVQAPPITIAPDKSDGKLALTISGTANPGVYTLVLRGTAQAPYKKKPTDKPVNIGLVQPSLPITLTIVPTSLATVTASMPQPNVKPGAAGEILVKVTRQHNFTGEYKVKLVLPPNVKGLSPEDVVIPAGKDQVTLVVGVARDMKPGNVANLTIQVTALFDPQTPVTSETKFNGFNVVKQ